MARIAQLVHAKQTAQLPLTDEAPFDFHRFLSRKLTSAAQPSYSACSTVRAVVQERSIEGYGQRSKAL